MREWIALSFILVAAPAASQARLSWPTRPLPDAVRVHAVSWHDRGHYNNANPGLAFHWPGGLEAGGYYNSVNRASWYAGFSVPVYDRHRLKLDVLMGVLSGYSHASPLTPVLVPVVGYRFTPRNTVQVVFIPRLILPANIVHVMVETRLGRLPGP